MKNYSIDKIRETYSNAYKLWTKEEDINLAKEYSKGMKIEKLAETFGRKPGAISSRLEKLKLPGYQQEKQERELVRIAFKNIKRFIKDWQKSPYEWDKEIDIQTEISGRIKYAYKKLAKDTMKASYKVKVNGFEQEQLYSRVCCEPLIYYQDKNGERYSCFPDIVIYKDIEDPASPPDKIEQKINWPMLWVCEIKYWNEWISTSKKDEWDIEKMRYLLRQKDGAKYACWLTITRERTSIGNGINRQASEDKRLVEYEIKLPALKR